MGIYKRGDVWWYRFKFAGESVRESTKQCNKRVAEQMEAARKTQLAKGEVGLADRKPIPTLTAFAPKFMEAIETHCAEKPATIRFYKDKVKCLLAYNRFATARLDRIDEGLISTYVQHQTRTISRRGKPLAPAS